MDLSRVLAELRWELERLDAAIVSLERLNEEGRKRGRPPKMVADIKPPGAAGRPGRRRAAEGGEEST
jgi:hypothetical protein